MRRDVAWSTLLGCLDRAGAQRLQGVLRAGAAAERGGGDAVLVDRA